VQLSCERFSLRAREPFYNSAVSVQDGWCIAEAEFTEHEGKFLRPILGTTLSGARDNAAWAISIGDCSVQCAGVYEAPASAPIRWHTGLGPDTALHRDTIG